MGGGYLVGVAFWLFIGACAVTAIITEHKKRSLGVDLLRTAIEKGQPLDPQMVERIFSARERDEGINPVHLNLGGIITIASGVGIGLLAFFISQVKPAAFFPILGAGVVAVCVGVGLMIGARMLAAANRTPKP